MARALSGLDELGRQGEDKAVVLEVVVETTVRRDRKGASVRMMMIPTISTH